MLQTRNTQKYTDTLGLCRPPIHWAPNRRVRGPFVSDRNPSTGHAHRTPTIGKADLTEDRPSMPPPSLIKRRPHSAHNYTFIRRFSPVVSPPICSSVERIHISGPLAHHIAFRGSQPKPSLIKHARSSTLHALPPHHNQDLLHKKLGIMSAGRPSIVGDDAGPTPPFPLKMEGKVISGFGRGSKEVSQPPLLHPVNLPTHTA